MALNLEVNILGEYKNLTRATKGATKQLQGLQKSVQGISRGINSAFAAIGVGLSFNALAGSISRATKAAVQDTKAQALLAKQLQNTLGASDALIASVEEQISQLQLATGVVDDELRPAFAQLVRSTGDTEQALRLLRLATNISAGSGRSLAQVSQALSRAVNGNTTALARFIPSVKNSTDVIGDLEKEFAGAAEAANNQDPYNRLNVIFGEIQETIGTAFIPALTAIADWITENLPTIDALATAISERLKTAFEDTGTSAENFGAKVANTITQLTEFLNGTAEAGNVFYDLQQNIGPIFELVGAFGEVLKGFLAILNGVVDGLFGWINLFLPAGEQISGLAGFVEFLGKKLQEVGEFIGFVISFFIPFTKGFQIIGGILKGFSANVGKAFGIVGDIVKSAFKPFFDFFNSILNGIRYVFAPGLVTAQNAVASFVARIVEKVPFLAPLLKFFTAEIPLALRFFLNLPVVKQVLQVLDYIFGGIRSLVGGGNAAPTTSSSAEDRRFNALRGTQRPVSTGAEDRRFEAIRRSLEKTTKTPPPVIPKGKGATGKSPAEIAAEKALEAFRKNVQNLVDTVEEALEDARTRVRDAATNFRDAVSLSFGIITNGAFAVFDVNRVIRQMQKIKEAAKTFVDDIKALQAGGADQALIDQLLGMDPISGSVAARGLLASGRLQEFLDLRKELAGIGGAAGEAANVGIYGTATSNLETVLGKLNRLLEGGVSNVYNINIENASNMTAKEIIDAIKSYEKTTGKKVFSN